VLSSDEQSLGLVFVCVCVCVCVCVRASERACVHNAAWDCASLEYVPAVQATVTDVPDTPQADAPASTERPSVGHIRA